MKRAIFVLLLAAISLGGCAGFQAELNKINVFATKYGPIVGNDILMIANILVRAECSPALGPSTATAGNILRIVAPTSTAAQKVGNALNTNYEVAQQLCPLVTAISASVGTVPQVAPSQIVTP